MLRRCLLATLCIAAAAPARVVRVDVRERSDVLGSRAFGRAGAYERVVGRVYFAVDPKSPSNRIIRDLDKAPRNGGGLVEFSSDLYMLRPKDAARGNGAVLYEVSNRGRKQMLGMFDRGATDSPDPRAPEHFGDGFLMERGFTLLWLGWQFDSPRQDGVMRLYAPVATDGGKPIKGPVRCEFVVDAPATRHSLADRGHIPYPALAENNPALTMTVRDTMEGLRRTVPSSEWSIEGNTAVVMPAGFQPGKIYEVVYTAVDPVVVGLGPAAVRDFVSYIKSGPRPLKYAYGFGQSQSGRFLRTFLYFGYNRDERGKRVFDGMIPHVAGAGRGSFNHRFAQPSRDAAPFYNTFYPTDLFPFTDLPRTDPLTGEKGGLLDLAAAQGVAPKIFYTNSAYEYWGRVAALIHVTADGARDAPLPPATRIYFFAGGQHGPGPFPPRRGQGQNPGSPNNYRWSMRALLVAMHAWVAEGKEPPLSRYPRISERQLTPPAGLRFPAIPGVSVPQRPLKAFRLDFGPRFAGEGVITIEPPRVGSAFPLLLPQVDGDGNEISGVRLPCVEVPLATYTGWNLRSPRIGAPDEMYIFSGSYVPFPRTREEKRRTGDPRKSIEERYASRAEYMKRIDASARRLAAGNYLLESDLPAILRYSEAEWDWIHGEDR